MNLYLLTRPNETSVWDTYTGAVVRANSEADARMIHPMGDMDWDGKRDGSWIDAQDVKVELIGQAPDDSLCGVVFAAYKAG